MFFFFFFERDIWPYSNAKLLTQMHMELFGIRNGTKVWFGPRCEVACVGDIQFCTISKLARHGEGPCRRAVESRVSHARLAHWNVNPSAKPQDRVPNTDKLRIYCWVLPSPCARRVPGLDTWARDANEKYLCGTMNSPRGPLCDGEGSLTHKAALITELRVQEQSS